MFIECDIKLIKFIETKEGCPSGQP